jgi:hypothetical protein
LLLTLYAEGSGALALQLALRVGMVVRSRTAKSLDGAQRSPVNCVPIAKCTVGVMLVLCMGVVGVPVAGQTGSQVNRVWVGLGLGGGLLGSSEAITLTAAVAHHRGARKFGVRATLAAEILDDEARDIAVLVGRVIRKPDGAIRSVLEVGPAFTSVCDLRGSIITGAACENRNVLGVAAGASLNLFTGVLGGLGLDSFVNLNHVRPFGGIVLAIRLGNVR